MKLKPLLGLLCLVVIVFTSCNEDKAVLASGSCTFAFDSIAYSANNAMASAKDSVYKDEDTTFTGKALTIEALTSSLNSHFTATIFFPDTLAVGTYTQNEYASMMFTSSMSGNIHYLSTKTTIKITSINSKYAEGEFLGTLKNGETEKPLTDGKFKVNIY
ncbi:MAG TPA: hypothetical protein VJ720_06450 [Chitinophaga sp.]|nr:hypothetical protein [Chitinophaga sp.]